MKTIQPFGDRVLVKILAPEEEVAGGLLVAPVSKDKSNKGIVVAVGEGTTLQDGTIVPLRVKIGDTVIFSRGAGLDFSSQNEDYKVLSARDVLGKLIEGEDNE